MQWDISTDDISERERLAYLKEEVTRSTFGSLRIESPSAEDFSGRLRFHTLNQVSIAHITTGALQVRRDARDIARSPSETYFINLQLTGASTLRQGGGEQWLGPGDLGLIDQSRPCELRFETAWQGATVALPHHVLRPRLASASSGKVQVARADSGLGALASAYLRAFILTPPPASAVEATLNILVDLLALAFGAAEEAAQVAAPSVEEARRQALRAYLERNLADPSLSPASVAAALRMSTRYLHALFEGSGETLMRWVLARRLEHSKQDLGNPALLARTIADVAFGWGFQDLSHFGRAFKAAYGMTPREFRKEAASSRQPPHSGSNRHALAAETPDMPLTTRRPVFPHLGRPDR